jgi:hypothetical protein
MIAPVPTPTETKMKTLLITTATALALLALSAQAHADDMGCNMAGDGCSPEQAEILLAAATLYVHDYGDPGS